MVANIWNITETCLALWNSDSAWLFNDRIFHVLLPQSFKRLNYIKRNFNNNYLLIYIATSVIIKGLRLKRKLWLRLTCIPVVLLPFKFVCFADLDYYSCRTYVLIRQSIKTCGTCTCNRYFYPKYSSIIQQCHGRILWILTLIIVALSISAGKQTK